MSEQTLFSHMCSHIIHNKFYTKSCGPVLQLFVTCANVCCNYFAIKHKSYIAASTFINYLFNGWRLIGLIFEIPGAVNSFVMAV